MLPKKKKKIVKRNASKPGKKKTVKRKNGVKARKVVKRNTGTKKKIVKRNASKPGKKKTVKRKNGVKARKVVKRNTSAKKKTPKNTTRRRNPHTVDANGKFRGKNMIFVNENMERVYPKGKVLLYEQGTLI